MNQEERDFVVEVTEEPSETKSGKKKRKKKQNRFEKGFLPVLLQWHFFPLLFLVCMSMFLVFR